MELTEVLPWLFPVLVDQQQSHYYCEQGGAAVMSQIDNIFIQVRARLRSEGIKLWEEPYYSEDLGSIEAAMEVGFQQIREFKLNTNSGELNHVGKLVKKSHYSDLHVRRLVF